MDVLFRIPVFFGVTVYTNAIYCIWRVPKLGFSFRKHLRGILPPDSKFLVTVTFFTSHLQRHGYFHILDSGHVRKGGTSHQMITKRQSSMIRGIAILLMLIHTFIFAYTEIICLRCISNSVVFYVTQVILRLVVAWFMSKVVHVGKNRWKEKGNQNDIKKLLGKI